MRSRLVTARCLVLAVSLATTVASGVSLAPATQAEVEGLLARLGTSSCDFYRNGSWHKAADAQAHLRRKYDYLAKKGLVSTTEDFILKGATQSSRSGEAYQVRCPNEAAQPSSKWMSTLLSQLRKNEAAGNKP